MATRREVLRGGAAGLGALALPEWALPALVQGEELVEFTDYPEDWTTDRGPERRRYDIRRIDPGSMTPSTGRSSSTRRRSGATALTVLHATTRAFTPRATRWFAQVSA